MERIKILKRKASYLRDTLESYRMIALGLVLTAVIILVGSAGVALAYPGIIDAIEIGAAAVFIILVIVFSWIIYRMYRLGMRLRASEMRERKLRREEKLRDQIFG